MADATDVITAKALYAQLSTDRDPYLKRARRAAELTVPYLFPAEGSSGSTEFVEPNQGLGARGVRFLASKLSMSLFPINAPFFKYEIDDIALQDLTKATDKRGEIEKALSARERAVISEMNGSMFRPVAFEACRQLVVAGNYLIFIPKKGKPRGFRLSSYVVNRDPSGNVLDIIIKEEVARAALSEDIKAKLGAAKAAAEAPRDAKVEVYTKITLDDATNQYIVTQEIDDVEIDGEYSGSYPADKLPWLPLRFTYVEGEDYGRGFVDEYIGDLNSLDVLTEALRDGTVQGAKVVWIVSPNSTVSVVKLSKAENGAFVQGDINAIQPLRLEKANDFAVAERFIQQLTERLSFAFLLNTSVQRKGERVTAEEIRYMAGELDQGLGGVYSLLAEEFQMPVAKLFEIRMEFVRKVPPLPKEITSTTIVTGLDALGRGNDLANLDALIMGLTQVLGENGVNRYLNGAEYIKRRGAALGIDMGGLIRSDEEIAAADQQQQQMAMIQQLGPQAIAQMGGMAKESMKQPPQATTGEQNG
ncbi:putative head-to-tail joining protein [Mesorhizobium phage vB_MloP_Lo5R7ANS]|uniref:Putative head-to-tail joining protein n=1 Tax=Mesorhizobium phage vB_MloP_Lo5R7ANS TaxID=1527771 RepID=A0A076YM66_9CAUD|nr:head-tail adaptor [Mesorhizobium phage vB_MloP_Lo5R7ANS]AIK68510.1 putative head-to-tail joining protein [Mesorhizobium phage vB_MloP_Lo5R7ANS]